MYCLHSVGATEMCLIIIPLFLFLFLVVGKEDVHSASQKLPPMLLFNSECSMNVLALRE